MKERIQLLAKKNYCYGCLQSMSDSHNARTCTRWLSCSSCKGNHPTPLHGCIPKVMKDKADGSQDNSNSGNIKSNYAMLDNDVKCASTTAKSGSKVISMCIVPVKIKHEDINKMVTTYAMLGNCSQRSFILDSTIKKLGIQGIKTTLKLKTSEIPVNKEEITTPTKSKNGTICNLYQMKFIRMMIFMLVY